MTTTDPRIRRNRILLVAIFALFFTPLLLAMLMRSDWWDFTPMASTNAGKLLEPVVPLALDELELLHGATGAATGKWLMLYVMSGACDRACEQQVTSLRQVHKATGRNQDRVGVLILAASAPGADTVEQLADIYANFMVATGADSDTLASAGATPGQAFIVDPAANIILAYGAEFVPADINGDLKRLLKYSPQGESQ